MPGFDHRLLVTAQARLLLTGDDLGILDRGVLLKTNLGIGIGFGGANIRRNAHPPLPIAVPLSRVSLTYTLQAFADTAGTSQFSGALTAAVLSRRASFRLTLDNDAFVLEGLDRYRTGAVETSMHFWRRHAQRPVPVGLGAGLLLWTGEVPNGDELGPEDEYDMTGRRGASASHGVLFGAVYVGNVKLSVGWDSEGIRDGTQNWFHRECFEDARVPLVDRDMSDRWTRNREGVFVEVEFNPRSTPY